MPEMLRPRHEFPTPLFRWMLPVLVVSPVAAGYLVHPHGIVATVSMLGAALVLGPVVAAARGRIATAATTVAVAVLAWLAGLLVWVIAYPPG